MMVSPGEVNYPKYRNAIQISQVKLSNTCLEFLYDDEMGTDIANWIRQARRHWEKTQEQFAEAMGKTKGNISAWENGRHQPSVQQLAQISNLTGFPLPEDLFSSATSAPPVIGRRVKAVSEFEIPAGATKIRKVKLRLSAGIVGFSVEEEIEDDEPIMLPTRWLEKRGLIAEKLIAMPVKGHSMEPSLHEGAVVIVDTADTKPVSDKIFAVNYQGEAVIKRMKRELGFWWLFSDNPDQKRFPQHRCEGDACIILGKVVRAEIEEI